MPSPKEGSQKPTREQLETQIVRAQSWRNLFATPEEEMSDFLDALVQPFLDVYDQHTHDLEEYKVEENPAGKIHVIRRKNHTTIISKLPNGNVTIIYSYSYQPDSEIIITPDTGNINHPFTKLNTIFPYEQIHKTLPMDDLRKIIGLSTIDAGWLAQDLNGKPATKGWEKFMLINDELPQRIGHKIYANQALQAQAKLMSARPDLFPNQTPTPNSTTT